MNSRWPDISMKKSKDELKQWLAIAHHIDILNNSIAKIARWAVLCMLILGFWNVVGRYLGVAIGSNLSSNRLIEGQWYLFDLVFLLGLGWTHQQQGHVRVDVLQGCFKERTKTKLELFSTLLLLLPFAVGVMAISINPTLHSWIISEASPDPNGLPRYWVKTLIPIGFFFLALQGISEAIKNWSHLTIISSRIKSTKQSPQETSLD